MKNGSPVTGGMTAPLTKTQFEHNFSLSANNPKVEVSEKTGLVKSAPNGNDAYANGIESLRDYLREAIQWNLSLKELLATNHNPSTGMLNSSRVNGFCENDPESSFMTVPNKYGSVSFKAMDYLG